MQAIISDLEETQGEERQKQDVVIRKLMRRKSKRETAAIWSEIRNGVLRPANSVEDLSQGGEARKTDVPSVERRPKTRVRHLSDGNYDDVSLVKTDTETRAATEDNVYENVSFFQGSAQFGQTGRQSPESPPVETR